MAGGILMPFLNLGICKPLKLQQGGYLRRLIERADFTVKQTAEKVKAEYIFIMP